MRAGDAREKLRSTHVVALHSPGPCVKDRTLPMMCFLRVGPRVPISTLAALMYTCV